MQILAGFMALGGAEALTTPCAEKTLVAAHGNELAVLIEQHQISQGGHRNKFFLKHLEMQSECHLVYLIQTYIK